MSAMKRLFTASFLLVGALALTGCGSGGGGGGGGGGGLSYTGATTAAAVDSTNAKPLAESASEATQQAVAEFQGQSSNPFGVVISGASNSDLKARINEVSRQLLVGAQTGQQNPVGTSYTMSASELNTYASGGITFCSGSITISNIEALSSGSGTATITYSNLCVDYASVYPELGQLTVNGTIKMTFEGDMTRTNAGSVTVTYSNFKVTQSGTTYATLNGEETCSWDAGNTNYSCTSSSYYTSGGKTFKIVDASVSGDSSIGWTVDATFYHPDYGKVTVSATGLTFNCSNGHPDAGIIDITGASGSITIDFNTGDCNTYSGSWTTSSASGSFSGW